MIELIVNKKKTGFSCNCMIRNSCHPQIGPFLSEVFLNIIRASVHVYRISITRAVAFTKKNNPALSFSNQVFLASCHMSVYGSLFKSGHC